MTGARSAVRLETDTLHQFESIRGTLMQKYERGQRVKVADEMPPSMSHFERGFEAIIDHSYTDAYGRMGQERRDRMYSVVELNKSGKPVNQIAWYYEDQLTLLDANRAPGEAILREWKTRS